MVGQPETPTESPHLRGWSSESSRCLFHITVSLHLIRLMDSDYVWKDLRAQLPFCSHIPTPHRVALLGSTYCCVIQLGTFAARWMRSWEGNQGETIRKDHHAISIIGIYLGINDKDVHYPIGVEATALLPLLRSCQSRSSDGIPPYVVGETLASSIATERPVNEGMLSQLIMLLLVLSYVCPLLFTIASERRQVDDVECEHGHASVLSCLGFGTCLSAQHALREADISPQILELLMGTTRNWVSIQWPSARLGLR
eukprot:6020474-Amphidinium_carterae.1